MMTSVGGISGKDSKSSKGKAKVSQSLVHNHDRRKERLRSRRGGERTPRDKKKELKKGKVGEMKS